MWVFTPKGFISIVADRTDPQGRLLVRARSAKHLTALLPTTPDREPFRVPNSDYAWRMWIDRSELAQIIAQEAEGIDYPNFKNAIREDLYHDACLDVWEAMWNYQHRIDHGCNWRKADDV